VTNSCYPKFTTK